MTSGRTEPDPPFGERADLPIIGIIRSGFEDRFGIPRQPGLAPSATAELILQPPYDRPEALAGLEGCSHVWVVFVFHRTARRGWHATVRPPRLGGNRRLGVFASRSPFRPSPVGFSAVRLDGLLRKPGCCGLRLRDHDLADGTPVLDIKPYLPWSDALPDACGPEGFAAPPPAALSVTFSVEAEQGCASPEARAVSLRELIRELLANDPRPAYRRGQQGAVHGMRLHGHEVRWAVTEDAAHVITVAPVTRG